MIPRSKRFHKTKISGSQGLIAKRLVHGRVRAMEERIGGTDSF
jgi:hypothetical protein